MTKFPFRFFLAFLLSIIIFPTQNTFAQSDESTIQTTVHLLSYIALDYPAAVENGKIINQMEFDEQVDFAGQAYNLIISSSSLTEHQDNLLTQIKQLQIAINEKQSAENIKQIADRLKTEIIEITGIQTAPSNWPNLNSGRILYVQKCGECHGEKGDGNGILAKGLDPEPSDFLDLESISYFSPYQSFNTIKLGVQGTSMRPFTELSEQEIWDLAFYIKSLAYLPEEKDTQKLREELDRISQHIGLKEVATLDDIELLKKINDFSENPAFSLQALRTAAPYENKGTNSLPIAVKNLEDALESYKKGDKKQARLFALSAYLEGIEPVEARLRTIDPAFVAEIEGVMLDVRQAIEKDQSTSIVEENVEIALKKIKEADGLLKGQHLSYWLTFLLAGSIFLREGLEAFLILAVVLSLIRSAGAKKAIPWLHGGWISALILGIAGWFLSDYILQFGGRNREILEGLVALLAVVVLMWAGFWLHNKSSAKQWTNFVKNKIGGYLKKDRMIGLAAFSFMVVFREAFEVILFLQAINFETAASNKSAIGLGVLGASVFIAIFAFLFLKYSKMIPVKHLFRYSSWLIVLLAVILLGKGIHALQESGWVSVNRINSFRIDWLGVYPTLETMGSQILLLLIIFITFYRNKLKIKREEAGM